MYYYEFKLDDSLKLNSIHSIDYIGWKPRIKLLYDYDLIIVKDSKLEIMYDSENIVMNPGEAFLALPKHTAYIKPDSKPITGVSVLHFSCGHFSEKLAREIQNDREDLIYLTKKMKLRNSYIFETLGIMFEEYKYKRYGFGKKLDMCLSNILHELHRCCIEDIISENVQYNYNTINMYTKKIIDYIHMNYMHNIRSTDIVNLLGLNYDYLNSVFKSMTNFTIMNYVDHIRISKANQLIQTTSLKLNEIAFIVGIEDPHYFSKKFKKVEGVSPSEIKKQLNTKNTETPL